MDTLDFLAYKLEPACCIFCYFLTLKNSVSNSMKNSVPNTDQFVLLIIIMIVGIYSN